MKADIYDDIPFKYSFIILDEFFVYETSPQFVAPQESTKGTTIHHFLRHTFMIHMAIVPSFETCYLSQNPTNMLVSSTHMLHVRNIYLHLPKI